MTTICLVRHGETDWNRLQRLQGQENTPINEIGIAQARRCAAYIAKEKWDALYSSPLDRARDTAACIAKETGLSEIIVVNSLIERNYGEASGLLPSERQERFPKGTPVPGQESRDEIVRRACETLTTIAEREPNRRVLVVTHGGFINAMLFYVSGGTIGTGITRMRNASITRLTYEEGNWSLVSTDENAV